MTVEKKNNICIISATRREAVLLLRPGGLLDMSRVKTSMVGVLTSKGAVFTAPIDAQDGIYSLLDGHASDKHVIDLSLLRLIKLLRTAESES